MMTFLLNMYGFLGKHTNVLENEKYKIQESSDLFGESSRLEMQQSTVVWD